MTSTAFKTRPDAESIVPQWIPKTFTLDAWRTVLNDDANPVARWFFNSIMAATLQAILIVAVCSLAAYPLARMDFRGKKALFALIIATLFIPPIIMLIPNWVVVSELKWLDNLIAIIVPTAASAFGVFFLRQFFISLPRELEEAAYLDGANRWQIFWKVIVPLSKPALATLACCRSCPTGTTSSGRCMCSSAVRSRPSSRAWRPCRAPTRSATTC
jgi:multiple sugar transport system permease protein